MAHSDIIKNLFFAAPERQNKKWHIIGAVFIFLLCFPVYGEESPYQNIEKLLRENQTAFYTGKSISISDINKLYYSYTVGGFLDSLGQINYCKTIFLHFNFLLSKGEKQKALNVINKALKNREYQNIHKYLHLFLYEYFLTQGNVDLADSIYKVSELSLPGRLNNYTSYLNQLHNAFLYHPEEVFFHVTKNHEIGNDYDDFFGLTGVHPFFIQCLSFSNDQLFIDLPLDISVPDWYKPIINQFSFYHSLLEKGEDTLTLSFQEIDTIPPAFKGVNTLTFYNHVQFFVLVRMEGTTSKNSDLYKLYSSELTANGFIYKLISKEGISAFGFESEKTFWSPLLIFALVLSIVFASIFQSVNGLPLNEVYQRSNGLSERKTEKQLDVGNTNFKVLLSEKYPYLKPSDTELAVLIKEGKTNKEIAEIRNLSLRGVESARFRLRKKMMVSDDNNLFNFLNSI